MNLPYRREVSPHDFGDELQQIARFKGLFQRRQLVQDATQSPNVAFLIVRFSYIKTLSVYFLNQNAQFQKMTTNFKVSTIFEPR